MNSRMPRQKVYGIFLIALATLLFEVMLTRIFAVTMWYHYGFLAISLALMGTAVAAVRVFLLPQYFWNDVEQHLGLYAFFCAIVAPLSIFVHLELPLTLFGISNITFYLIFLFQLILFFLVFFFSGMCISIVLFRFKEEISRIYFYDLIGASVGSLLVVPLLYSFSGLSIIFIVSCFSCLAGLLFLTNRLVRYAFFLFAMIAFFLFLANDNIPLLTLKYVKNYHPSSIQGIEKRKMFEKWSAISRVAVFAPEKASDHEFMKVTNDAGAPTRLVKFDGSFNNLAFLDADSRQIVHRIKRDADVFIIGPGGGVDVLASLKYNQRSVEAVEINPVIGRLVTETYANYIGRIFQDNRVKLFIREGRNFIAGSPKQYDIIEITMIDSWAGAAAGAYVFNENSLYTQEAIRDYMRHLKPDGILSITRYYQWDEALRLMNMFLDYMEEKGIHDPESRLIAVVENREKYRRATLLMKNGPFTSVETKTIISEAAKGLYELIYVPHIQDNIMDHGEAGKRIRALILPRTYGYLSRQAFVEQYPKNITPATDNRPFFFFMKRIGDVFRVDLEDHASRRIALPILYGSLVIFTAFGILTIFLPLRLNKEINLNNVPYRNRVLAYFAMLGVGFMMIEISLIQRLTIFLGHPTYSFIVVLTSLLLFSGLGSLVSGKWRGEAVPTLIKVLLTIVALQLANIFCLYDQFIHLMWLSKFYRILLAVVTMAIPSFLMGMCLPFGMKVAEKLHDHLIPWGWGVNGAFSVLATILSMIIALNFGLKGVLFIGLCCYLVAAVIIFSIRQKIVFISGR